MAQSESTRSPLRRLVRGALIVLLVFLVGLVAFDLYSRYALSQATAGYTAGPLDFSEFHPEPLPEGTVNGSDYEEAAVLLVEGQESAHNMSRGGSPDEGLIAVMRLLKVHDKERTLYSEEDLDLIREQVERLSLALDVLDQGLAQTYRARYRTDWDGPPSALTIPNLLARFRFSYLLRARGELAIYEGRWEDGWREAARLQRFAYWTADSMPILINALIFRAIARNGMYLTQQLLSGPPVDPSFYQAVLEEASRLPIDEHFAMLIDAERSAAYAQLLDPRTDADSLKELGVSGKLNSWFPVRRLIAAKYLDWAGDNLDTCKRISHDLPSTSIADSVPGGFLSGSLSALAFDCYDVARKRDFAIADLDHLRLALELEQHHRLHGAYPAELGAFSSTLSVADPFVDDGAYPYALQEDGGYKLWSAFFNGVDEGGTLPSMDTPNGRAWYTGDLVWWVRGKGTTVTTP